MKCIHDDEVKCNHSRLYFDFCKKIKILYACKNCHIDNNLELHYYPEDIRDESCPFYDMCRANGCSECRILARHKEIIAKERIGLIYCSQPFYGNDTRRKKS